MELNQVDEEANQIRNEVSSTVTQAAVMLMSKTRGRDIGPEADVAPLSISSLVTTAARQMLTDTIPQHQE